MNTAPKHAFGKWLLALSMLVMGACGIMYEYALGTLGNHLMGSSHEQFYVIIGVMMFAMGVGAGFQRFLQKDLLSSFLYIEIILGLLGGLSVIATYAVFTVIPNYEIVLYTFAFVIGGLIGLEVPLLIRINEQFQNELRANLGNILSMDYIGSLIGALLFAYVLISKVGIDRIGIGLGLANIGIAAFGAWYFRAFLPKPKRLILTILGSSGLLITMWFNHRRSWPALNNAPMPTPLPGGLPVRINT